MSTYQTYLEKAFAQVARDDKDYPLHMQWTILKEAYFTQPLSKADDHILVKDEFKSFNSEDLFIKIHNIAENLQNNGTLL